MRKKAVCRFGVYLLTIYFLLSCNLLCFAEKTDLTSSSPVSEEEDETPEQGPDSALPPAGDEIEGEEVPEPTPDAPVIKSISISPGTAVVSKNSTCDFRATVTGENNYSSEVAWSVSGQKSQNTFMDSKGVLNVGSDETASSLVVKAVSKQDSNFSATALATVRRSEYSVKVKASPEEGGSVSGGGKVEEGGYATLSASAKDGFTFESWSLNGATVSRDSRYVADDIHSDRTYVANFRRSACKINVSVNDSNAGVATESKTVGYGENLTLEAAAREGYQFDGWMENGEFVSREYRLELKNITGSRDFVAVFSQGRYTLTLSASPSGAGAVSGQGTYDRGSNIKIIATPAGGYWFTGWTENGNVISVNQEYSVDNISRDMNLVANFEIKIYTINAGTSSLNGTITPEGKSTVSEGGEITYTIKPKSGYTVKAVYVDGKSVGAVGSYSFTDVNGNHNISVDFIAASEKENGSGTTDKDKENKKEKDKAEKIKEEKTEKEKDKAEKDAVGKDEKNAGGQQTAGEGKLTGTLLYLDISPEEAERMIDLSNDKELMLGALATGDLRVTVHNDFADDEQKTAIDSFDEAPGVENFDKVIGGLLTREEKLEMLTGDVPIAVILQIRDAGEKEPELIIRTFEENKLPERKIVQYFDMSLTKSRQNDTQTISSLPRKLQVVINIPEHLKAAGRDFYILRLHNGENGETEYTELADEDDSPDTITFATDRFSPYAIAYTDREPEKAEIPESPKGLSGNRGMANIVVVAAIILATGITFFLVFYIVREEMARRRDRR